MRTTVIAVLTAAAMGLLTTGAASAAPANGTAIGDTAASTAMVQKAYWHNSHSYHHHYHYNHSYHPRWWHSYNYVPYHHHYYHRRHCWNHRCWY